MNSLCAVIAAWLNASRRNRCALWAVLWTGYHAIFIRTPTPTRFLWEKHNETTNITKLNKPAFRTLLPFRFIGSRDLSNTSSTSSQPSAVATVVCETVPWTFLSFSHVASNRCAIWSSTVMPMLCLVWGKSELPSPTIWNNETLSVMYLFGFDYFSKMSLSNYSN